MSKDNHTQSSSEARVKYNPLNEDVQKELYRRWAIDDVDTFRHYCQEVIALGTGKAEKKFTFTRELNRLQDKNKMLEKVNNFIMAGMGLGV